MKIFVLSDVHTEFESYLEELPEADVCVLAGDWCVAHRLFQTKYQLRVGEFLARLSEKYEYVVAIAGNHEYYHGEFDTTDEILHKFCNVLPNVYFLQREYMIRDDIVWAGCTLWSDFDGNDPVSKTIAEGSMTDYRVVTKDKGCRHLNSSDILEVHEKDKQFILDTKRLVQASGMPLVMITHHGPSFQSCHPMFYGSRLNGSFYTELPEEYFKDTALWFHGHTHWVADYEHFGCRVVLNARGYPGEISAFDPGKVVTLEVG